MKKYYFLSIMAAFVLGSSGCSDFLEEENLANVVADEYYTTTDGYKTLVNASYSTLRTVYREPWLFEAGTDMYVVGRSTQPEGVSEYRNLTPDEVEVENFYRANYAAIQICNTALHFNSRTASTPSLPMWRGEVMFLRANYYFLLVQHFGGVSLVTDRLDQPVSSFSRNSAQEVYTFIINEMNEALTLVPETSPEFGRVTKRVIRHFLAKVHLTRGYETFAANDDFSKAAALADAAINNQALSVPFEQVFTPGNDQNAEILFSVQYSRSSIVDPSPGANAALQRNYGNLQHYFFGPYMGGQGAAQGYPYRSYTLVPTMYLFNQFTEADARFDATFMVQYYQRYYDYYDRAADRANLNVRFYYAPQWASSPAQIAAWRAVDPARRTATTVIPYSPAWEASPQTVLDNATPAVKKFDDPQSIFSNAGSSTRDFFLARLGETYLIAAEAYFKMGDAGTAAQRLNEVRRRAAKPGREAQMAITASDVNIDFILDERARELVGEYHRWTDLKRTGTLMQRTRLHNREIRAWYSTGVDPFLGQDGNFKILRPIPRRALDLNNAEVAQNPGY